MASKTCHTIALACLLAALTASAAGHRAARAQRKAPAGAAGKALVFLDSTRERDGLRGPVRRVRTEVARLTAAGSGQIVEGPRRLLEVTVYDPAGRRIENSTYPVISSPAGEELNAFDERGNLAETVLRDARGRVLSRTVYAYEFDRSGNWTKMTASLSVVGPAGSALEPVEVTYRAITYYAPEAVEATQPIPAAQAGAAQPAPPGGSAPRRVGSTPAHLPAGDAPAKQANDKAAPPQPAPGREAAAPGREAAAPDAAAPAGAGAAADFSSLPDVGLLNQKASSLPPPAFPVGSTKPARGLVLVVVEVVVDEAGRVISASAPSGPQALRQAAEEAARRAVFAPFATGGVARRVRGRIRYTFPYEL
jgi:TonB family protein